MNKVLSVFGIMIITGIVKLRIAVETVAEMFRGEGAFFTMIGICSALLLCAIIVFSWTSRSAS